MPSGRSISFSTGPCSMCTSTKPRYLAGSRCSLGMSAMHSPACSMASRMRDAVGVLLVQPGVVEMPGQRARAQEHRLVALAFFFGEAHHLDAEGQPPAGAVQLAHAGHRHEDAQPPVVLAAVAHGVVVRAGEQPLRVAVAAVVDADHVADGVDLHLVEAAVGAHPVRQALRAGAVRVGQVGDGEFAALGITRVAVRRQALGPVPHQVAQFGHMAELVVQPDLGHAVDVAQALGHVRSRGGCPAGARRWR